MHKDFKFFPELSRRDFIKSTGALVIAFHMPFGLGRALAAPSAMSASEVEKFPPNAFIRIDADNSITIQINKLEMGQGVNTSMAQLIAEELDCDWKQIRSESCGVNPVYNHTAFGTQMTGGSSALLSSYEQHRKIGATARALLVEAAAKKWDLPADSLRTENGFVLHPVKGKLSYGELAQAAAALPAPKEIKLKDPKNFKIIGKSVPRVDAMDKSTGKAQFGLDVQIPGMLYACVARAPVFGAKLKSFAAVSAKAIKGVLEVVQIPSGVAVIASNTYAARQGRDALQMEWENTVLSSSESILKDYQEKAKNPGAVAANIGDVKTAITSAKKIFEAQYHFPYLAHACMEPMNCTINYDGANCEIWSGHQMPTIDRDTAAAILGLPKEKVKVNTTYAGGSFGRRANKNSDYVVEAAHLAKIVKKPLKIVWTREDDMHGGYYRPFTYHKVKIGLDAAGMPLTWDHAIVGQSVVGDSFFESMMVKNGVDPTMVEGVADSHYEMPHRHVELQITKQPVPVLWWRSVGHTHTAYVMETLMDEIAEKSKTDALLLRKKLLAKSPRHLKVLDLLAKHSPWGKKAPAGRAYGLAVHESFNSVVGQVAEVSYKNGTVKVHRVWCAVDCGRVVNPEGAKTQIEGGIIYGLSAALYGKVPIEEGRATANNFNDYPVLRMPEAPKVDVFFVEGGDKPTGLGEPGVPPIAPAVANALYKLTKKRARFLPFSDSLA